MPAPPLVPPSLAWDERLLGLWWAVQEEGLLAGMPHPTHDLPFQALADVLRLDTLVSLTTDLLPLDYSPLARQHFPLQDLAGGHTPTDPASELATVWHAADTVAALVGDGCGVLVHCAGGRGRTGTVIGAALVALGHAPDGVRAWLHQVHSDRGGWPESRWQSEALGVR